MLIQHSANDINPINPCLNLPFTHIPTYNVYKPPLLKYKLIYVHVSLITDIH